MMPDVMGTDTDEAVPVSLSLETEKPVAADVVLI